MVCFASMGDVDFWKSSPDTLAIHCPHSHPTVDQGKMMISKFRIFTERAHIQVAKNLGMYQEWAWWFTLQEEQQESIYPNMSCSWTFYQVVSPQVSCLEVFVGGVDVCLSKSTLSFHRPNNEKKGFKIHLRTCKRNYHHPLQACTFESMVLNFHLPKGLWGWYIYLHAGWFMRYISRWRYRSSHGCYGHTPEI